MANSYDLTQLDSHSFEHMVNFLAMKVLGNGVTGFATGPDGGRDGYLKGKAPYPSSDESWEGIWYIQSKFHKPNLSTNAQKWLIKEVIKEIKEYSENPRRKLPNIWIIATNIEPSGQLQTGAYDKIIALVKKHSPDMKVDIWGGRKILDFLMNQPTVANTYGHFLTPGHVISALHKSLTKEDNKHKSLIEHFMVSQFKDLSYTKLEQAGSSNDHKPKIHELFRDLPIRAKDYDYEHYVLECLVSASCNVQKITTWLNFGAEWKTWTKNPKRTRVILLKGGPGQGKSTVGQYFAQVQRAAYILSEASPTITPLVRDIAKELKEQAQKDGFWPTIPRIPIFIELKEYANWYISRDKYTPRNLIEYICDKVNLKISFVINSFDLRDVLSKSSWFINFDGLDEVPNDLKDDIANEVIVFSNEFLPSLDSDALILCTTRPQGYSGQFDELDASICNLIPLPKEIALSCAEPVVRFGRSEEDGNNSLEILETAMLSPQVKEIMTTPLQSHIMAVVVRDGGKPPEKRWELFNNFYTVMKKREVLKNFSDVNIAALLQEKDLLLKAIHDRLGICLHVRAEYSQGAEAALPKSEFRELAVSTTQMLMDGNTEDTVNTLMEATIERLVFVNTPDSTEFVRFDIRQLQEFFAAEFIHNDVSDQVLIERLSVIVGDAHWREVVHFILSALIHYKKKTALTLVASMLHQLDVEHENHKIKYFNKKSSIGALLVLRLAEEGMLEQDKRIRSLFSKCLLPLWGNPESDVIVKIISLQMVQSKNWLLSNMVESFIDMDYSETLSCVLLFSVILDSSHDRFDEVHKRIESMPDELIISSFLAANVEYHHSFGEMIQPWFIQFTINKYFSEKTSHSLLTALHIFLSRYTSIDNKKIQSLSIDAAYLEFLNEYLINSDRAGSHDIGDDSKYCFITTVSFDINWANCSKLPIGSDKFSSKKYSFPIEIFKKLDSYFKSKSVESFRELLFLIDSNDCNVTSIPDSLIALIPLCFDFSILQSQVKTLLTYDDSELLTYLASKTFNSKLVVPDSKYVLFNNEAFSKEKWGVLCRDFPDLALNVITSQYS